MAFFPSAYNTRQYEVAAIGTAATNIPTGAAVKLSSLPTSLTTSPGMYTQVTVAGSADSILGVVSTASAAINNANLGRVVLLNSGMFPVLMNSNAMKGAKINVNTADGKWDVAGAGEFALGELLEDATANNLAWAKPIQVQMP